MDFNTILDSLRSGDVPELFLGAYVKKVHDVGFNPSLDADVRPLRIITEFKTVNSNPGAVTILDSSTDSFSVTTPEEIELTDLVLITDVIKKIPQYIHYDDSYWITLGREHSLLRGLKLTDTGYGITMDLISQSLAEPLSKVDMEAISNITLNTMLVPLNLSAKPLTSLEIITTSLTISRAGTPSQTVYAKLTPIETTENDITWEVTSSDETVLSLAPDVDERICVVTFVKNGVVTLTATSNDRPDISHSVTFTISD